MDNMMLDIDALEADMADHVERTSARKFSLAVSHGRNPDWYRNYMGRPSRKTPTVDQFLEITQAMGRNPMDYVRGAPPASTLWPNEAVLTQTLAALLSSVGVDPYEDERARKIARLLPNALQDVQRLIANLGQGDDASPEPHPHDRGEASLLS